MASGYPVRGVDSPSTWREFEAWFATDADCAGFLEKLRWPDGFVCPRCEHTEAWRMSRGQKMVCAKCQRQTSVTAGTIFEKTRTPLRTWFAAVWLVTSQKHGMSALADLHSFPLSREVKQVIHVLEHLVGCVERSKLTDSEASHGKCGRDRGVDAEEL